MLRAILFITVLFSLGACASHNDDAKPQPIVPVKGSIQWYNWVDSKVITGDDAGHGPDIGSAEWCGVIDFKLFNRASGLKPCSPEWDIKVTDTLKNR